MLLAGKDISKHFGAGAVQALSGVSLRVDPAQVHLVLGENGAGKSTLFNILAGDVVPDQGSFAFPGGERPSLAYVRQEPRFDPRLRVWEHLLLGHEGDLWWRPVGPKAARMKLKAVGLDRLPVIRPEQRMGSLSPGERYLVSLAAGLTEEPRIVILDEPFAPCSPDEREILGSLILSLRSRGAAVLMASHRIKEAMEVADQLTVLRRGRVTLSTPREATSLAAVYEAMFPPREEGIRDEAPLPTPPSVHAPVLHFGDTEVEDAQGRQVDFGGLAVTPGERLGILSKDPQLLRRLEDLLGGFAREERGHIVFGGQAIRNPSARRLRAFGVRYVPRSRETRGLALAYSVEENLRIPLGPELLPEALGRLSEEIETPAGAASSVATLSGGNRARLVLLRETVGRVSLLVLARPSAGLDSRALERLSGRLERLAADGAAVVLLSSDPEEVLALCKAVRVVSGGLLRRPLNTSGLSEAELMELLAQ